MSGGDRGRRERRGSGKTCAEGIGDDVSGGDGGRRSGTIRLGARCCYELENPKTAPPGGTARAPSGRPVEGVHPVVSERYRHRHAPLGGRGRGGRRDAVVTQRPAHVRVFGGSRGSTPVRGGRGTRFQHVSRVRVPSRERRGRHVGTSAEGRLEPTQTLRARGRQRRDVQRRRPTCGVDSSGEIVRVVHSGCATYKTPITAKQHTMVCLLSTPFLPLFRSSLPLQLPPFPGPREYLILPPFLHPR